MHEAITSPPTKKISPQNLNHFDEIKLINPIKIEACIHMQDEESMHNAGQVLDDHICRGEEEDSDDDFTLRLKPMDMNGGHEGEA